MAAALNPSITPTIEGVRYGELSKRFYWFYSTTTTTWLIDILLVESCTSERELSDP